MIIIIIYFLYDAEESSDDRKNVSRYFLIFLFFVVYLSHDGVATNMKVAINVHKEANVLPSSRPLSNIVDIT